MKSVRSRIKRISVGHTIYSFKDGGMERGLLNVINHSDPERFRHVILCLTESGAFAEHLKAPDCLVVNLQKKEGNDLRLPKRLAAAARQYEFNILHARGWPTLVETAVAALLANVKTTIYGFHGKTIDDLQGIGLGRRVAQWLFIRSYNRVITLNQRMANDFARECSLSSGQIQIIANGVDIHHFSPCADRSDLRGQFGLPLDRLILGNVARLDPVKNHELIIRALHQLRQHPSRPFLLLVGEGGHRPVLEAQINRLGLAEDVKLFGYSEHISALLSCMDLYVQSSFYEGFSNTILEAMACGVPVLASRVGGTADLFTDGEQGLLFPSDDDAVLVQLITRLADDRALQLSMAHRARRHVIEHFSVQIMVRKYEALYQELAEPRLGRS